MGLPKKIHKRSIFISTNIRELNSIELQFFPQAYRVLIRESDMEMIANIPPNFSVDEISRPIVLSKDIVIKIEEKHGKINITNLLINAHSWDIAIKNMDHNPNKINLIKLIPNSNNFLLIGAIRNNGYFILTHFETEVRYGNELKSLLGRGDLVSEDARPGSPVLPIEALNPPEGVSGVKGNIDIINESK